MIEIICNGDDENKSEGSGDKRNTTARNSAIRRPKNIKQIGDLSSDRKIYIEDYAFTYINSIAYGSPDEEQAGVMLGECQKSDDEKCVFIKGIIKAKNSEDGKTGIYFDEKVWDGIYSDIEKYFPNLQVVGWFAAMPNTTPERMQYLKKIHLDNFPGSMKTMYLINTIEKEENFYLYENGDLKRQKGYVCFYERNYEMQEYMLEKRGAKTTEQPASDHVMKSIRNIIQEKEEVKQQKRSTSLMYGISTFLVVVVLVIGINLLNSYERMKNFDKSLDTISNQISNINNKGTDAESGQSVQEEGTTSSSEIVPVNKLAGNVYPTEEATTEPAVTQPESQSTSQTDTQPTEAAPAQPAAEEPTYQIHIVESGDTIMNICKRHYGNASRYNEIIQLNHLEDADKLYVGQEIKLP